MSPRSYDTACFSIYNRLPVPTPVYVCAPLHFPSSLLQYMCLILYLCPSPQYTPLSSVLTLYLCPSPQYTPLASVPHPLSVPLNSPLVSVPYLVPILLEYVRLSPASESAPQSPFLVLILL